MKKKYLFPIVMFMAVIFSGCDYIAPGLADYTYELSPNYMLLHVKTNGIYSIKDGTPIDCIINDVTEIALNKQYILASSKNKDSKEYWILYSDRIEKIGPFTLEEFNAKRDELKIDSALKLKDPEEYRYLEKKQ